jgi:uncharacterized protein (TIGR02145 family)
MKTTISIISVFLVIVTGCKKHDSPSPNNSNGMLSPHTIIVSNSDLNSSLIAVDSATLTFKAGGSGVDKIKVGSILVSDISAVAPTGFLRKVTAIAPAGDNIVYTTQQASLTDAIINGSVKYKKILSDSNIIGVDTSGAEITGQRRKKTLNNGVLGLASFTFGYDRILYDADGNLSTTNDQIEVSGQMQIQPTLDFELDIEGGSVKKFVAQLTLNNTNAINVQSQAVLANLNTEIVLMTFQLEPFTIPIAGIPIPIASQLVGIYLGVDGSLTARATAGARNINTVIAGISYQNSAWNTLDSISNSFGLQPLAFEGDGKIEPWLGVRYEILPYGLPTSKIYLEARGSVIGEATVTPDRYSVALNWDVELSAKAQAQIFDNTILDFDKVFFEKEFLIYQSVENTVMDIDKNVYSTDTICGHIWMVENLRVSHYRNGDALMQGSNGGALGWPLDSGAYVYSEFHSYNNGIYGKLYNGHAVEDRRGLAPLGWHIATDAEWDTLITCLGGDAIAGRKLKSTSLWSSPGSNESGFAALPADNVSYLSTWEPVGNFAYFWSFSNYNGTGQSWARELSSGDGVTRYGENKGSGLSVRCVKDY